MNIPLSSSRKLHLQRSVARSVPRMGLLYMLVMMVVFCVLSRPSSAFLSRERTLLNTRLPAIEQPTTMSMISKTINNSTDAEIEYKDFWGVKLRRIDNETTKAPCVPNLDKLYGALPNGAYVYEADEIYEPKPTCRLSISLVGHRDRQDLIQICQAYLDSGFQTFHGASPSFIREFQAQTPSKVAGLSHWVLEYDVPIDFKSNAMIRQQIFNLMDPMDAIDTLQINYNPESPYHLDVLDVVMDLRREGWIRSIGVNNFPSELLEKATTECGFSIQTIQQNGNILYPQKESPYIANQWLSNSLAGGLLSNHYTEWIDPPLLHRQWDSTVLTWAKAHGIIENDDQARKSDENDNKIEVSDKEVWEAYRQQVLHVVQDMAWRYGVSVESIALRWAIESKGTTSVKVPVFAGDWPSSTKWKAHIKGLREVFTFRLEEEDALLLSNLRATKRAEEEETDAKVLDLVELEELLVRQGLPEHEIETLLERQQQQQQSVISSYPNIDFKDTKLWL